MKPKEISKSVLKRLPSYLTYLKSLPADGPANMRRSPRWIHPAL